MAFSVNNMVMSKFKFVNIVDLVFITICTFILMFAWVQFFVKSLFLSLFVSVLLTFTLMIVVRVFKSRKYNAQQLILTNNTNLIKFKLAIQTMPTLKLAQIIKQLIPTEYNPKISKNTITFIKNGSTHNFALYYSSELNENNILEILKTYNCNNIVIFCSGYNRQVKEISTSFNNISVELISLEQLYEIFNKNDVNIPTDNITLNQPKSTLKQILKRSVSREKSKGYFISGIILLISSILVPYKIYYLVFSSLLIILSLVCRIKPNQKINTDLFK